MITQRRVFQAKPGRAAELVVKLRELLPTLESRRGRAGRVYTGLLRGHADRVVLEVEVESAGLLLAEGLAWAAGQDTEYREAYSRWHRSLAPLIDGETVKLWRGEDERPGGLSERAPDTPARVSGRPGNGRNGAGSKLRPGTSQRPSVPQAIEE